MTFSMKQRFKQKGFTLIELMIVVAVIAIIAAIALPSYTESIRKARRVDAKQGLTEAALKLENFYARNATYTTDLRQVGYNAQTWNNIPFNSSDIYYQIRVLTPNAGCAIANCFRVQSRNRNDQTNDTNLWYRLWSSGRKQYRKITGPTINGWK